MRWHMAPALCIRAQLERPSCARMHKPEAYATKLASVILLSLLAAGLLIPAEAPYTGPV